MTKLLEEAIAEIRKLPDAEQDRAAEVLLGFAQNSAPGYELTPAQVAEVKLIVREIDEGTATFVTEEEMEAILARFRT
ncbi:hypothetical protein [Xanthobacter tagetidis]|jgi:hypothetical protein|uniref:Uncharacterized protein n=1 Tax=Xanthobacter tagetidis TaxID=60216 RepID=A0A3L6ZWR3_9HYPH|nr:hypothetical protein [Xanthobacter tagetidis]MBB6310163.1 hypothetical protein [Xanthobacter tagetidis]RLP72200.1 hypothetical protein D9R14_21955 [Xanthobacter tagetidis]